MNISYRSLGINSKIKGFIQIGQKSVVSLRKCFVNFEKMNSLIFIYSKANSQLIMANLNFKISSEKYFLMEKSKISIQDVIIIILLNKLKEIQLEIFSVIESDLECLYTLISKKSKNNFGSFLIAEKSNISLRNNEIIGFSKGKNNTIKAKGLIKLELIKNIFIFNGNSLNGEGVIWLEDSKSLNLQKNVFVGNLASKGGGVLFFY